MHTDIQHCKKKNAMLNGFLNYYFNVLRDTDGGERERKQACRSRIEPQPAVWSPVPLATIPSAALQHVFQAAGEIQPH